MSDNSHTRIVILGAGFGGVYTLKHLHKLFHGNPNVELTIVNRNNYFLFTPLLHEVATGGLWPEDIVESLRRLFPCCPIRVTVGEVEKIFLKQKKVRVRDGRERELSYDYLVIALGSHTIFFGIPGAEEHSINLKTLEDAVDMKNYVIRLFEEATHTEDDEEKRQLLRFVVVGGGPTGVELAAELSGLVYGTFRKLYSPDLVRHAEIILLQRGGELLPQFPEAVRKRSFRVLRQKGVDVRLNTAVTKVAEDSVEVAGKEPIPTKTVLWTAGVVPNPLDCEEDHVPEDKRGRIEVNEYLQMKNDPRVFVVGDKAAFYDKKRDQTLPMLAQVASKQGPAAARNIYNLIHGREPLPFVYKHKGDLVSLGEWNAAGKIGNVTLSGRFTWWLWRTVYLSKIVTMRKRVEVAIDWTMDLFLPRDTAEFYKPDRRGRRRR